MEKKLQRNVNEDMIGGVAAGLAEYFAIDTALVRVAFIVAVFAGFSGVLAYIILWIALPAKKYVIGSGINPMYNMPKNHGNGYKTAGIILICMGLFFLLREFHVIPFWFILHKLWPLAIIVPGILLLTGALKKEPTYEERVHDITWDKKQDAPAEETPSNKDQSI